MKKFSEFINESYNKEIDLFGESTFVDQVFDDLVGIVCDEKHISEKSFKEWDQTTDYIRQYFDNNSEILQEIDKFKDRRSRFCAEYLYDKHFSNRHKDKIEMNLIVGLNDIDENDILEKKKHKGKILHGLSKPKGFKKKKHSDGVSLGKDNKGYFCYTHRARSKSHSTPEKIPQKEVTFIETTG